MNSSMIGKIAKAKEYAQQPSRLQFSRFEASFRGENDNHIVKFDEGTWDCTCHFFHEWGICGHTMAVERMLYVTIPVHQRQGMPITAQQGTVFAERAQA